MQRLDVFLAEEVVDCLRTAAADGGRHHFRRLGLGGGTALARLGVAERGLAPALGLQDLGLFGTLRLGDLGGAVAFGLEDLGPLFALGLHLPGHGLDHILRRYDVLQLDAQHLDAPGVGRLVDDRQQPVVDLVAFRQHIVERQAAHDVADVGQCEVGDRLHQVAHLVGRGARVNDLIERDRVDADDRIVLGDHLLLRNVEYQFLHVDLATTLSMNSTMRCRPGEVRV